MKNRIKIQLEDFEVSDKRFELIEESIIKQFAFLPQEAKISFFCRAEEKGYECVAQIWVGPDVTEVSFNKDDEIDVLIEFIDIQLHRLRAQYQNKLNGAQNLATSLKKSA